MNKRVFSTLNLKCRYIQDLHYCQVLVVLCSDYHHHTVSSSRAETVSKICSSTPPLSAKQGRRKLIAGAAADQTTRAPTLMQSVQTCPA
jgi:hypothetical protein